MSRLPRRLWQQVLHVVKLLHSPAVWIPTLAGFSSLTVSLLIVPDTEPSAWNWFGLVLIALFGALSILSIAARALPRANATGKNELALIAIATLVMAMLLNLFMTLNGTAILLIGICLIAALALQSRRARSISVILTGVIVLLVPIWTWISLDETHAGLLLLFPLGILAWFSDRHMRAALTADTRESATPARSWRFISWLGILIGAILTTVLALSSNVGNGWAVVGTLGAITCIGADAGVPQHASLPGRYSRPLVGVAFAWLALCWLASL